MVGACILLSLLDNGCLLAAEVIIKWLTISEFCSAFIVAGRPDYNLTYFAESVLHRIFYKNSFLFSYVVLSETDPRYSDYVDEQSLWRYQQPRSPEQAFDLQVLKQMTPLKLWKFYKTTCDLSRNQREATRWVFDTYSRPGFGAKEILLNFNPKYPVYSVDHQDHRGYFQFSVHSHPGAVRNKQGQDLLYRSGEEYRKVRGGHTTNYWSPNGEYLAVIDRLHKNVLTFYKFCPHQGTVRRIKNISFQFEENCILSKSHWCDSTSMLLPSDEKNVLQKICFHSNHAYKVTREHAASETGLSFFGSVPGLDLLFHIVPCNLHCNLHDHIYFSRLGETKPLSRLSIPGIVTSYCLSGSKIYFMTRNHKNFAFRPVPENVYAQADSFDTDNCPFAYLESKISTHYNYVTKLFRFICFDLQTLQPEILQAQLPLAEYKGDSSDKCAPERLRKCAKRSRLTSSKFYLCYNTTDRTYFISKTCKAVFSSYTTTFKFCHPSQPIFATCHPELFKPTKIKFYLETRADEKLKKEFPKKICAFDYNRPLTYKKLI